MTPLTPDQIREVERRQWDIYWRYWRPGALLHDAHLPTPDLLRKEHFEP